MLRFTSSSPVRSCVTISSARSAFDTWMRSSLRSSARKSLIAASARCRFARLCTFASVYSALKERPASLASVRASRAAAASLGAEGLHGVVDG